MSLNESTECIYTYCMKKRPLVVNDFLVQWTNVYLVRLRISVKIFLTHVGRLIVSLVGRKIQSRIFIEHF